MIKCGCGYQIKTRKHIEKEPEDWQGFKDLFIIKCGGCGTAMAVKIIDGEFMSPFEVEEE